MANDEIVLSIEETNKLRAKLGLKPLIVDETPLISSDGATAVEDRKNNNHKNNDDDQASQVKLKERLEQSRMKRKQQERLLSGKSIGDTAEDVDDTVAWVQRMRSKPFQPSETTVTKSTPDSKKKEYVSDDLAGLKVGHDLDRLEEGSEQVLVLKDSNVLDDDDDMLVNVNMLDRDKAERNIKERRALYNKTTIYDDEEEEQRNSLLPHYDKVLDGDQTKSFTLGSKSSIKPSKQTSSVRKPGAISLDFKSHQQASDYATPAEMPVMKKVKKKNRKQRTTTAVLDDDMVTMDTTPVVLDNFVDDDDLQMALAKTRRSAVKKRKLEEIAEEVQQHKEVKVEESAGLILSETTEFVRNLKTEVAENEETPQTVQEIKFEVKQEEPAGGSGDEEQMADVDMKYEPMSESEEDNDKTNEKLTSFLEEPLVARGMGATLALLRQKGDLERRDDESHQMDHAVQHREKWLQEQKQLDEYVHEQVARAKEDAERRGDRLSRREQNELFEKIRARELEKRFQEYQPTIKLEYKDQYGRELDQKEAFKMISHRFHGKMPGKAKMEKKLKKIAAEMQQKQSPSDTLNGMTMLMHEKQKQSGQAHVVLSSGTKTSVSKEIAIAASLTTNVVRKQQKSGMTSVLPGTRSRIPGTYSSIVVKKEQPAEDVQLEVVPTPEQHQQPEEPTLPARPKIQFGLKKK